jgi:hypothetical protein
MKTSLFTVFSVLSLACACGRVEEDAPVPGPVTGQKTAAQATPEAQVERAPTQLQRLPPSFRQASYRTTTLELADGAVLDAGIADLVIDTASAPPRAELRVSVEGAEQSVSGKLTLDFEAFLAGKAEAPSAVAGSSVLYLRSGGAEPAPMPVMRLELKRTSKAGRRARFLVRAFAPDDSLLATLETQFSITCLAKDQNPNGHVGEGSAPLEILTTDPTLTSDNCRPFAALR